MNATIALIAALLGAHFIADFLLQPRWMALGKSVKFRILGAHCGIQFAIVGLAALPFVGILGALQLSAINAALHGLVDWNIWRGYKRYAASKGPDFKWWEDHWFFATIGADQLLHGLSLLLAIVTIR